MSIVLDDSFSPRSWLAGMFLNAMTQAFRDPFEDCRVVAKHLHPCCSHDTHGSFFAVRIADMVRPINRVTDFVEHRVDRELFARQRVANRNAAFGLTKRSKGVDPARLHVGHGAEGEVVRADAHALGHRLDELFDAHASAPTMTPKKPELRMARAARRATNRWIKYFLWMSPAST